MPADPTLRHTLAALKPMISGRGLGLLVATFFVVAALDTVAVGLLPAFIAALADPRALLARVGLQDAAIFQQAGPEQVVVTLGGMLALFFLLKNVLFAAVNRFQAAFIAERQVALSTRLLSTYLRQPYTFHLQRNTGDLIGHATGTSYNVFACVVVPGCVVATETLVVGMVTALLLVVSPFVTLFALGLIACVALGFYWLFRARLRHLGERQQEERLAVQRWTVHAFGGIKEAIILGCEPFFVATYARLARAHSRSDVALQTIRSLPWLFTETFVACALVLVVALVVRSGTALSAVFPTLALFGIAALRLMPSVTRIVGALTTIRFYQPSVDTVANDLAEGVPAQRPAPAERLALTRSIEVSGLSYAYPGAAGPALRSIDLRIGRGETVAFVGRSGAGKSTLVDILIGLHSPSRGTVQVDGRDIAANVSGWQRNIGYVPQAIFLTDDTLRRNVAFGIEDAEIDDASVANALELAQLGDFVRSLPEGLDARVGERGSRISGGQRQRIGIARALYRNPEVLVLDEATSALDWTTAQEVTAVLAALAGRKTVLLIAHQQSTVRICQRVFLLREGKLAAEGSYAELAALYPELQSLAE